MTTRKILPAVIGLLLPFAAMVATPASAQTHMTKSHKAHHSVHKASHKTKAHAATTTKAS